MRRIRSISLRIAWSAYHVLLPEQVELWPHHWPQLAEHLIYLHSRSASSACPISALYSSRNLRLSLARFTVSSQYFSCSPRWSVSPAGDALVQAETQELQLRIKSRSPGRLKCLQLVDWPLLSPGLSVPENGNSVFFGVPWLRRFPRSHRGDCGYAHQGCRRRRRNRHGPQEDLPAP